MHSGFIAGVVYLSHVTTVQQLIHIKFLDGFNTMLNIDLLQCIYTNIYQLECCGDDFIFYGMYCDGEVVIFFMEENECMKQHDFFHFLLLLIFQQIGFSAIKINGCPLVNKRYSCRNQYIKPNSA